MKNALNVLASSEFHYKAASILLLIVTFVHVLSLPLVVTYDGMEYVHLADLIFTHSFASAWNYLRTPFFPFAVKLAFFVGGEQPQAAMIVTTLAGVGGALLTGSAVRTVGGNTAGALTLLAMTFYPVLVCYEHMLLSETGIFFFLAFIIWLLVRSRTRTLPALLACAIALGYYWRPTILYLSPALAVIYLLQAYLPPQSLRPYAAFWANLRKKRNRAIRSLAIVALGPWLLVYPWLRLSSRHPSTASLETITNGMYKQIMVPPDDPVNAPLRAKYKAIIQEDIPNGRMPLDGLSIVGEGRFAFLKRLSAVYIQAGLTKLILAHPKRYFLGVTRTFVHFLGVPHHVADDENWQFSGIVFQIWPATQNFHNVPGWMSDLTQFEPRSYGGGGFVGKLFGALGPPYTGLVLLSSVLSLWWFLVSLKEGNTTGLVMAGVPLAFLFLHALTMMGASRYAFPVYPQMIANTMTLAHLALRGWMDKRTPNTL